MADEPKAEKKPQKPTERVVLAEVEIGRDTLVEGLPHGVEDRIVRGETVKVYVELGEATGSKGKAVEALVGETKGAYRAPSASSWKGVVEQGEEVIPESRQFRRSRVDR